jgi:2-keto-4-pentenoate hydratase/2-oxohepta-3-ene-1,7-dioic acid hydratase in catechol pathway
MKIVRFEVNNRDMYGLLENDIIRELKVGPFEKKFSIDNPILGSYKYKLSNTKLLAPCCPTKYLGVGLNFSETAKKYNMPLPEIPILFLKPSTAIIGPNADVIIPNKDAVIIHEGELAIVIGKEAKNIPEEEALQYILGCTCTNDVSDISKFDLDKGNPLRTKALDTFGPIGPCIDTVVNSEEAFIRTWVNGELRQEGNTKDLIFGIKFIISYSSSIMTLLPGDIIATGTPPNPSQVKPGDIVKIEIEGIGILENKMVAAHV